MFLVCLVLNEVFLIVCWKGSSNTYPTHCDVTNAKNMATMRIIVEDVKRAGNVVNKILDHDINDYQFPCKYANCGGDHPVYARTCESWRQEKEVLTVKHPNNVPYYEVRKLVVGSKTTTYSQAVQRNKSPYNKYETIVKILIQLEPGEWESFINKIKAFLDTTRATDASTRSVDLAENKEESSTQTQTRLGKTYKEEKRAIIPTSWPIKRPVTRSPTKSRSKDRRSPNTTSWFGRFLSKKKKKKTLKEKQKPTLNPKIQETENIETMNKFSLLEKMQTESSPKLTNPTTQKNKSTNSLE